MTLDWRLTAIGLAVLISAGCNLERPQLFAPGRIDAQQRRAVVHDPYADPDAAPSVVGARPREYDTPLPPAVKNQPNQFAPGF